MNTVAMRSCFLRAGGVLALMCVGLLALPAPALADPFVGKEWHITFDTSRPAPHLYFPNPGGKTFRVLETHEGRWYLIEFQVGTSGYGNWSTVNPPMHLRGTTQRVWVSADMIFAFYPKVPEAPSEATPPPSDVAPPAGPRTRPRSN